VSRFAVLVALAACGDAAAPPASYTLSAPGITVTVTAHPFQLAVADGAGRVVLDSLGAGAGDGYSGLGWTTGDVNITRSGVSPGYFFFESALAAWRDGYAVASAVAGASTLDLVLTAAGQPDVHVHLAARPSALRVEAQVDGPRPRAWSTAFRSPADEGFLGLGERFTRTNFRGLAMYSWSEEGGIGAGEGAQPGPENPFPNGEAMSYYPVPFFVSTHGYGFWLDSTWWNRYDLATDRPDAWRVWHIGPTLAFEVYTPIPGDARPWPYHIIDLFTKATGRPMLAPAWTYGPRRRMGHGGMVGDVREVQAMRDLDLAITAMDDANHFTPRGPVPGEVERFTADNATLAALGYRVVAYYNAFFSDAPTDPIAPKTAEGLANGYFLKTGAGVPSKAFILTGGEIVNLYTVDFTSPGATTWYTDQFAQALAAGYSGWMYDFGEYVQPEVVAANGMTGEELHNLFPVLYQKAAHDALEAGAHAGDWLTFARSGYTGASQYTPQVWSGDPAASFDPTDGLPSMVRGGVNMGVSGVPNWGGDIGGYHCIADGTGAADGELLTRWIEQGAATPNMHDENACVGGDSSAKASIWTSPDAQAAWKTYARLHTRMAPYFVALGRLAHETGAPIMRHVFLEHPERADWSGIDDAYFLGPALFVAPVVTRGARQRTTALPPGLWLDWHDAKLVTGGDTVTLDAPLGKLPLLLADGQLVPLLDPSIDTLSEEQSPDIVGPADVADVYDVVGLLSRAAGHATFQLADGDSFDARFAAPFAPPDLPAAADEASIATCAACWRRDDLGGNLVRVRVTVTGGTDVHAGGLTLAQHARPRTRWDLYLVDSP
jgi:alpha-D-xyloside xylohydrolase